MSLKIKKFTLLHLLNFRTRWKDTKIYFGKEIKLLGLIFYDTTCSVSCKQCWIQSATGQNMS